MKQDMRLPIGGEEIAVQSFLPESASARWGGIFLHGGGGSCKERGEALCTAMARRGMHAVALDFSGWGHSTMRSPPSLQKRVDEAQAVIAQLLPSELPLAIMAFSMSGQVAIELLRSLSIQIRCLALFNPAIYDRRALHLPFGADFSAIIRSPGSWRNADIASAFAGYSGKTLLFMSEHDQVIPAEVFTAIAQAAPAPGLHQQLITSAPHQLGPFLKNHPELVEQFADTIAAALQSASVQSA